MFQKIKNLPKVIIPSMKTYVIAAIIVLLAFLSVTFWSWRSANTTLNKDIDTSLEGAAVSAAGLIQNTVTTYSEVLRGAVGLFNVSPSIGENTWQRYIENLDIQRRYPGFQSAAFTQYVSGQELGNFLEVYKSPDGSDIQIRPTEPRNDYYVTRLIAPKSDSTYQAIGYDPHTEPIRKKAMDTARDSGQVAITNRTVLVQDQKSHKDEYSVIIFVPVYKRDMPVGTVSERRAALLGFVSGGVRIQSLMDGLFSQILNKDSAVQIYDGTEKTPENLVYQSDTYEALAKQHGVSSTSHSFEVANSRWTLSGHVNQNFASPGQRRVPQTILISGIALSFVLAAFLFILMISRARSITIAQNKELQDVKDSLISLASHQLRTPATGVKQFIGMVLEGYVGDINDEQRSMLQKAYTSNERQIEIINQILHVSRADSGRLVINKTRINLVDVIKEVIGEMGQSAKLRKQRIIFKSSSKKMYVYADKQYLTMVIDNLLSNASKYSNPGKSIRVTVSRIQGNIQIQVTDKGVGISQADRHLLFQKFSRIHNDLSVEAGGNGIGLYLCKEILDLHGGSISVESKPNVGSTFTVLLPVKKS